MALFYVNAPVDIFLRVPLDRVRNSTVSIIHLTVFLFWIIRKHTMNALIAAILLLFNFSAFAQSPERHSEAGIRTLKSECRPDVPAVHLPVVERVGDELLYKQFRAVCVPKIGTFALIIDCDYESNTCVIRISDHRASEIENGIRLLTDRRLKRV